MVETARSEFAERHYARGAWRRSETFTDDLKRLAREMPDRLALATHFWKTSDGPDVTLTYAELAERVDRVAAALVDLGVERGDRVANQVGNQWQSNVVILACARIGAVVVAYHVATVPADMELILADSGAKVAVSLARFGDQQTAEIIAGLRKTVPTLEHQIVVGGPVPEGALDFDTDILGTACEPRHELDSRAPSPDDLFEITYTSGTTGRPKGVMHSYNSLYACTLAFNEPMGIGPDDVISTPAAVGGLAGFVYSVTCPLLCGAAAVWTDSWDPHEVLETMSRYEVTIAYFVPPLLVTFLETQEAERRPLALRRLVAGSAPIPPTLPADVRRVFGLPLHPLWGMTENGSVTLGFPGDPDDWAVHSDGRPVDWMELRLVDDDGNDVPAGEPGRLWTRGANQCLGYFGAEDQYAQLLTGEWFETGDVARPDGRGGIKIIGRTKDMINKGGLHIPAGTVEKILFGHPHIRDVAVVGEKDPVLGEVPVAFVVAQGGTPTLDEARQLVFDAGLNPGFAPDALEIIDALPRNNNGKVLKRDLRRPNAGS
ncbi:MAG: AMP-binding protein [Actinocatenispora sp.]